MKKDQTIPNAIKLILIFLVIILSIYLINRFLGNLELILGAILVSFGILSIIWTVLARYNLSPQSRLRIFANNFLACSIAILVFTIMIIIDRHVYIKGVLYVQYFFIFITYFFFIIVSYYLYTIGREFGFQKESIKIKKRLQSKSQKISK